MITISIYITTNRGFILLPLIAIGTLTLGSVASQLVDIWRDPHD